MAANPTNTPFDLDAASDLTDLSIQEIWIKSPADLEEYHKEIYYSEPVPDYITKDSSLTSISTFSKIPENGNIPADSPYEGFKQTYTQSFFSGMLRITRPMWRYGIQTRRLEAIVMELKNDAIRFRETVLSNVINNATSTAYTETTGKFAYPVTNTGGDGLAFQSASHTREDGGTNWSNVISDGTTNNMSFDYNAWKAALKTGQAILGGVGEILDLDLDAIVCKKNSSVHFRAQEILKSIERGDGPLTANRIGAIDRAYEILDNPYLTSDTAWGALDRGKVGPKWGLQEKEGMPLILDPQFIDYDNKEMKYSAGADFAYGFNDSRIMPWSTGANA
jgi:hypothetical protein